jgi:hypothetical protein
VNNQTHYDSCQKAEYIDDEKGHKIVALALKVGEEQYCRYHKAREGHNGNYEISPRHVGCKDKVDKDEHYDGIGDKLDELAGAVVLYKVNGNDHIPYYVKAEKGNDRPGRTAYRKIDDWAGDSRNDEGESENSYKLRSRCLLLA